MKRVLTSQLHDHLHKETTIEGWVETRRDHGKLIFLDVKDQTGVIQTVVTPANEAAYQGAEQVRDWWVVRLVGEVKPRPEKTVNKDQSNGDIELAVTKLEVLNDSPTPPIDLTGDGYDAQEEKRLQYRYLDLRRDRLQQNIKLRHRVTHFIRNWLNDQGFYEIETPNLTRSTPEGARDYVVPSRLYPGNFYALPQSPQQYKQLLMVSGFEKYFQIARCFRDEDTRKDRQPEFTQLDLEMSFVNREDVINLNEQLLTDLISQVAPDKKITTTPFPRLTYEEAISKCGTDRPDLRENKNDPNELAFVWVIDFPFFEKTKEGGWTFTHNPFSQPITEHQEWLLQGEHIDKILTTQYDIILNGYEIGGGSIRSHRPEILHKVFEVMGLSHDRIQKNFGHMLEALSFGAPPHGGIAWGLDRLVAVLANEPNIREVIAFPKTGDGRDPMMGAPAPVDDNQLKELHLRLTDK